MKKYFAVSRIRGFTFESPLHSSAALFSRESSEHQAGPWDAPCLVRFAASRQCLLLLSAIMTNSVLLPAAKAAIHPPGPWGVPAPGVPIAPPSPLTPAHPKSNERLRALPVPTRLQHNHTSKNDLLSNTEFPLLSGTRWLGAAGICPHPRLCRRGCQGGQVNRLSCSDSAG